MRAFVDANVILRFITGEPTEMAEQARTLFEAVEGGEMALAVDEIIVAEVVWVLDSFYEIEKRKISQVLQALLIHDGIEMADKTGVLEALTLFADKNVDFADALVSVHMTKSGVKGIFSFDKHFDRLPGVKRLNVGTTSLND